MRDVFVAGVHTLRFAKYLEKSIKDLAQETFTGCLADCGLSKEDINALWFSNSGWCDTGQSCIRGQVALRPLGVEKIPITNVENACAGASTAFHHAWLGVASGLYDVTMAVGAEKLYSPNRLQTFVGFMGGIDFENVLEIVENLTGFKMDEQDIKAMEEFRKKYPEQRSSGKKKKKTLRDRLKEIKDQAVVGIRLGEVLGYDTVYKLSKLGAGDHSPFMDVYGFAARQHMKRFGSTVEQLAAIASKNHKNGSLNENAQYRFTVSVEQALTDRIVSFPLTRSMCAPIGDGAASAILVSRAAAKKLGVLNRAPKVRASILGSGADRPFGFDEPEIGERLSKRAYEAAGVGPEDIDLAEVHDATAYGELRQAENLGFCPQGEGGILALSGATDLGGKIPLNTSGGLISRGHPVGASGLAQIHELVTQLRGEAGKRQVENPVLAMAENGGGALGAEEAAMCIHILEKPSSK
ncbi:MAG: thiolase family protein [Deltaproteobacteria bacterium]|nr:thiolase family protein [Deltaproteobacteria bacterium]